MDATPQKCFEAESAHLLSQATQRSIDRGNGTIAKEERGGVVRAQLYGDRVHGQHWRFLRMWNTML